jgi:ParB family chromosome partitioning protein
MAATKKGLGRGLSALIPDSDMEFLSRVARGDTSLPAFPIIEEAVKRGSSQSFNSHSTNPLSDSSAPAVSKSPMHAEPPDAAASVGFDTPVWLDVQSIEANPYQPRRSFAAEEMRDLVASVREHGIIQPILVRPVEDSGGGTPRYQLIAGERRWRASQEAGLAKVPAVVRPVSDQQALELALIENVQRHDISAMDAAKA